ncbi:MAG: polysaccharide biosynthesis C-terminal domain-containing protein [Candidatus Kapaibacterium sp.]
MTALTLKERATRGFAWNHLYRIVDYGLWNLYTILVVRKLGPELSGPYVFYLSLATTLALVGVVGVDGILLRFTAKVSHTGDAGEDDITSRGLSYFLLRLLSFRVLVTAALLFVVAVVLIVVPRYSADWSASLGSLVGLAPILLGFLAAQSCISFCTFALIGMLEVRYVFFGSVIARVLLVGSGVLLLTTGNLSVTSAALVHAATAGLNALLLVVWLYIAIQKHAGGSTSLGLHVLPRFTAAFRSVTRHTLGLIRQPSTLRMFVLTPVMLYGITTWGSDLLSTVLGRQPDVLMMRAFLGEHSTEIVYYQVASTLLLFTEYIFLFGFSGALVSVFSSLAHDDEKDMQRVGKQSGVDVGSVYPRLLRARKEITSFQTTVILPLCGYFFVFAPQAVAFIYGTKFDSSVPLLRVGVVILALTIILFGGGVSVTSLVTIGKERTVFRNRLGWGILNLIVNVFLIRAYGAIGALLGTQLSNMGACATEYYFASRWIGPCVNLSTALVCFGTVLAGAVAAHLIVNSAIGGTAILTQLVLGGVILIGVTILGYVVFRVESARKILERVSILFKPSAASSNDAQ